MYYWTLTKTGYRWYDPITNQFDDRLESPQGVKQKKGTVQYSLLYLKSIINTVPPEMVQNAERIMKFPIKKVERILQNSSLDEDEVSKIIEILDKKEKEKLTPMQRKIAVFNYLFNNNNAYITKNGNTFLLMYKNFFTEQWETAIMNIEKQVDFHLLCNVKLSDFKIKHSYNACKVRQKINDCLSKW